MCKIQIANRNTRTVYLNIHFTLNVVTVNKKVHRRPILKVNSSDIIITTPRTAQIPLGPTQLRTKPGIIV